jgi:hypothetical protein
MPLSSQSAVLQTSSDPQRTGRSSTSIRSSRSSASSSTTRTTVGASIIAIPHGKDVRRSLAIREVEDVLCQTDGSVHRPRLTDTCRSGNCPRCLARTRRGARVQVGDCGLVGACGFTKSSTTAIAPWRARSATAFRLEPKRAPLCRESSRSGAAVAEARGDNLRRRGGRGKSSRLPHVCNIATVLIRPRSLIEEDLISARRV